MYPSHKFAVNALRPAIRLLVFFYSHLLLLSLLFFFLFIFFVSAFAGHTSSLLLISNENQTENPVAGRLSRNNILWKHMRPASRMRDQHIQNMRYTHLISRLLKNHPPILVVPQFSHRVIAYNKRASKRPNRWKYNHTERTKYNK